MCGVEKHRACLLARARASPLLYRVSSRVSYLIRSSLVVAADLCSLSCRHCSACDCSARGSAPLAHHGSSRYTALLGLCDSARLDVAAGLCSLLSPFCSLAAARLMALHFSACGSARPVWLCSARIGSDRQARIAALTGFRLSLAQLGSTGSARGFDRRRWSWQPWRWR